MRVPRRLLAGVLLASFGMAVALGMIEAGVRALHMVPTRFWEPDPLLGIRHIAGKKGWWTQEEHEFFVPVQINSQGLRDVERPVGKPPGVFRVLLLGDSYIEALQVPIEECVGRRLESRLNMRDDGWRYDVISMGVSGYGTASEYLYYREIGRSYEPDVVVLAFFPGNDVKNNSPTLEPALRPVYDEAGALQRVTSRRGTRVRRRGLSGRILGWSHAYQYGRKTVLTRHPAVAALLIDVGLMQQAAMRYVPMHEGVPVDYWVYAATPSPEWKAAWDHTERLLAALHERVAMDGARFVMMLVTARDRLYADAWRQVREAHPRMAGVDWDLDAPERRVMRWCKDNAIPCVQLIPVFAARLDGPTRLHFVHDGHWTAAGHALAADTMARILARERLLPDDYTEGR